MDMAFWVGAVGANAQEQKLDIVSNNLANVNNDGFKPQQGAFQELLNYNLNAPQDHVTNLQAGAGVRVSETRTSFDVDGMRKGTSNTEYMIGEKNQFFMLRDPDTGDISYTRDGHFHAAQMADGTYRLMTESGKYVLDANQNEIQMVADIDADGLAADGGEGRAEVSNALDANGNEIQPGVFSLTHPSRLLAEANNEYVIRDGDVGNVAAAVKNPVLVQGYVETSGTDVAYEMTNMIEAQRAFQYAVRMVQTSDELMGTVNTLRS